MTIIRSWAFVVASLGAMVCLSVTMLPALLLERRLAARVPVWAAGVQIFLLDVVAGLRLEVRGANNLPDGPALIAVKHQSALETYALVRLFPEACFVIKQEIVRLPVVGWFVSAMDCLAIDRAAGLASLRRILGHAARVTGEGRCLVIFPEGTRTAPGERVAYQRGIAGLYAALGVPVVPVALNCGVFWPRRQIRKRPGCAVMAFLEAIPPALPRARFMEELESRIETATSELVAEASVESTFQER